MLNPYLAVVTTTLVVIPCCGCFINTAHSGSFYVLRPESVAHYVEQFNVQYPENVVNAIPDNQAWSWMAAYIPLFECPDREVEEIYYYRWWVFRKHLKHTPAGWVITEFLKPVRHAGAYNTISCAVGFHLAEGRWLRDNRYLDEYILFWLRGHDGGSQPHFHDYSSWFAAAVWDRYLVNGDRSFVVGLLPDLITDYQMWERRRQLPNGLFWQYDVADGMEESISGSRTKKNVRPTINCYMYANACAIANIARLGGKNKIATEFGARAKELKRLIKLHLWDTNAHFFKVLTPVESSDTLVHYVPSTAREAIGYIPWMFSIPSNRVDYELAWLQLTDPQGFAAPFGITTAERRHVQFRSHGVGRCEWDGPVWPFATCQTLYALANYLRSIQPLSGRSQVVSNDTFFTAFLTYTHCQRSNGKPYVGEYLDEVTGDWIDRKAGRRQHYNHSTYADLLIGAIIGLCVRADDRIVIHPLLQDGVWDWFCLDGVPYRAKTLTVLWDKNGSRYSLGAGLSLLVNGRRVAHAAELGQIVALVP